MSIYKSPLRPFDPIIVDDQPVPISRYFRDDFAGSGQDSFTDPPAQDQSMWQKLVNIMPIASGTIKRRFGYASLSNFTFASGVVPQHLYTYQRDIDGLRKILVSTTQPVPGSQSALVAPYDMLSFMVLDPTLRGSFHYTGVKPLKTMNITNVQVQNNVVTLTGNNTVAVGDFLSVSGLSVATFLNSATGLQVASRTPTQITFNFNHANLASTPDTGTAITKSDHTYFQIDASRFWWIKGDGNNPPGTGGWPWDINLYDSNFIYLSVTELNFSSPNDCKRQESLNPSIGLKGLPFCKRFSTPGDFVLSPESVRVVPYSNGVAQPAFILGHTRCELHGPFLNQNFNSPGNGNLPPNLTTLEVHYRWGGTDPSPVYNTREIYTFAWDPTTNIRYGLIQWQTANWNATTQQYDPPNDWSLHNNLVAGVTGLPAFDPQGFGGGPVSGNPPAFVDTTSGGSNIIALNEDGSIYASGVSSATVPLPSDSPRVVVSRNSAYIYGTQGSNTKWDGNVDPNGNATDVTKWGIDVNNVGNSSFGPNLPTTFHDFGDKGIPWSNPNNILLDDGQVATVTQIAPGVANALGAGTFNMNAAGNILGLKVDVKAAISFNSSGITFVRPTAFVGTSNQNVSPFANPQNAIDGLASTSSTGSGHYIKVPDPGTHQLTVEEVLAVETWKSFPAYTGPAASAINLKITWSSNFTTGGNTQLRLSVDGVNFTTIASSSSSAPQGLTTLVFPLAVNQDLTKLQIIGQAAVDGTSSTGLASLTIVDIWVEVTGPQTNVPPNTNLVITLLKGGQIYGQAKSLALTSGTLSTLTYGGTTDLWGGVWSAADINDPNFGVLITDQNNAVGVTTISIDSVKVTAYTSGAGVTLSNLSNAGNVVLTVGRVYYVAFKNSLTGHISDLSFPSASTGPLTNKAITLGLPVNLDPQVTSKVILATADGGDPSVLFLVAEVPNSTTSFVDNTVETSLVVNQQYLFTDEFGNEFGISQNDPPPQGTLAIKHKGRIWMAVGQNLFFSKSITELTLPNGFIAGKYEESWPQDNYFDISAGAETIRGLLSDGSQLYIGTERHIRILFGDNPDNFQEPEVVHQEVGILNQDVWQTVFIEGAPAGAMWITPDFRVVGSDFNQYQDVGHPIQDILNSINPAAAQTAHAMFVSDGEFDLYILAVPTGTNTYCDTHLIYDMRSRKWFPWYPSTQSTSMLYNVSASGQPMWLFTDLQHLLEYSRDSVDDSGTVFPASAQTSWLHMSSPTQRKILNELDIIGDPALTVTVEGASTQAEFRVPKLCALQESLIVDALGHYKLLLAAANTNSRYYRFTFISGGQQNILDSYSVLNISVHSL